MTMTSLSPRRVGPRVRPNEIWRLGPHRLLCGDATSEKDVGRLLDGRHASLTITSPPYNLGGGVSASFSPATGWKAGPPSKYALRPDKLPESAYRELLVRATENALSVSDLVVVVFQQLSGNKIVLMEYLHHLRHHLVDTAIWDKGHAAPALAHRVMNSQFEFLLLFSQRLRPSRAVPTATFHGTVPNVYAGPFQRGNHYAALHGATFPPHLPLWLMRTFDSTGGLVFDPFLGTGTTLMAAHELGRTCYGIEIESGYCDLVIDRWERETGVRAERDTDCG